MKTPDASAQRYAMLGLGEIPLAGSEFPLCFAKDAGTGRFDPIALLGLDLPRNLFWRDGGWRCIYVPEWALMPQGERRDRLAADLEAARSMAQRFAEMDLIRALELVLVSPDGAELEISGLYSLSQAALAKLTDSQVVTLYRDGHLAAATLMVASLNQLERLLQLRRAEPGAPRFDLRARLIERF